MPEYKSGQDTNSENNGRRKTTGVGKFRLAMSAVFLLVTALIWGWFYTGQLRAEEIISPSMAPTIDVGDRIIVELVGEKEELVRGEVIIFDSPDDDNPLPLIKRITGIPGDFIFMINNRVYINHDPTEDELKAEDNWPVYTRLVQLLNEETYFVQGDNADNSHDSRAFGPISRELIIGKALVTYYPFEKAGWVEIKNIEAHESEKPVYMEKYKDRIDGNYP